MRVVLALIVAGSLTGCATYAWQIPAGRSQMQFNQDSYECAKEAQQLMPGGPPAGSNITNTGMYHQCMNARGYTYGVAQ